MSKTETEEIELKRKRVVDMNEKHERSRSGRIIKRKRFSSGSEMSEDSEYYSSEGDVQDKYSDDSAKSGPKTSSESTTETREIYLLEKESDVDIDVEKVSVKGVEKPKKKNIKNNKAKAKSKSEPITKEKQTPEKKIEQLEKKKNKSKIISKLSEIDIKMKQTLNDFNNMTVEASLNAMTELLTMPLNAATLRKKPVLFFTLHKCRKFSKSESVRHKAEYLFNKFRVDLLSKDKKEISELILSNTNIKDMIKEEFYQCLNSDWNEIFEKQNSIIVNNQHQNVNDKDTNQTLEKNNSVTIHHNQNVIDTVTHEELKNMQLVKIQNNTEALLTNNLETINQEHQNVNGNDEERKGSDNTSLVDQSLDIATLLSSSIAVMKSLENRRDSMEDAFGIFVAHQLKTFSDPVLKDRVMSRIVSVIMDEKYE